MSTNPNVVDSPNASPIPKNGIRPGYKDKEVLWWTVQEAADFCVVRPATIHKWSHLDYFNTRRIPRKTCIDRESLERFLHAQRMG